MSAPLDKSQVYWNFGGSTVLTKKFVRLTPSTQDRKGWLWNEYPIESENFEVEFKTEVFSKPHFGGDGFGFWILSSEMDPAFTSDPDALTGPIFGMKNDFKGVGVIFDVYDNDNRRNNPSVFVLANFEGEARKFNHDNDYEDDMYTKRPGFPGLLTPDLSKTHNAYRCVADLRNTGKVTRVLVKYLHKVLHVYVDTQNTGYKFCLAVQLDQTFVDHHFAFSAATGQVADNHDIVEVTTRYLKEDDVGIDNTLFPMLGDRAVRDSRMSATFWGVVALSGFSLTFYAVYELVMFRQLSNSHHELVRLCQQFNKYVVLHWGAHAALVLLLLVTAQWKGVLLGLPLLALRGLQLAARQHLLSPALVHPTSFFSLGPKGAPMLTRLQQLPPQTRQLVTLVAYLWAFLYYVSHLVDTS